MKTPFSPWLPYLAMIALCCALGAYVGFERPGGLHIGSLHWLAATNGVVRSLRGTEPVTATVALDGGSVEDAEVASGCFVQVGDRVVVRASMDASGPRRLLVFPADMGVRK